MDSNKIWQAIELELRNSKKKHVSFPDHIVARAAVIGKESGKLIEDCMKLKYDRSDIDVVQQKQFDTMNAQAISTAAACIRFLETLYVEDFVKPVVKQPETDKE